MPNLISLKKKKRTHLHLPFYSELKPGPAESGYALPLQLELDNLTLENLTDLDLHCFSFSVFCIHNLDPAV